MPAPLAILVRLVDSALSKRALMIAIYALGLVGGTGMVIYSPLIVRHQLGGQFTDLIGALLALSSAICLASQLTPTIRWRLELTGVWILGAAVSMYAGIAWLLTWTSWPGRVVEAVLTSMLALMLARHLRGLYLFNRDTREAPNGVQDGADRER